MGYQYLLFDLDGTLTDPKEGITKSFQYALEALGIHEPDADKLTWVIGPPLMESLMRGYGLNEEQAKFGTEKYRERYVPVGYAENSVYTGMEEVLVKLCEAGFVLATATSKPTGMAEKILEHFGLSKYFSVVGGASMDSSRSKKVDVIRHTLNLLGVSETDKVLMIGDREYDVLGAKELGIDCLGVLYGYGSEEELSKAGAFGLVKDTMELYSWCMGHRGKF